MSQAKPRILGGRLKRNEQCFKDVSSEASNSVRMSQAIREACRGCLKPRMSQKRQGCLKTCS
eukprot:3711053-Pyramimonas_sp.AAC.1